MKHLLAFICIAAIASAQNPIPIPSINLNILTGTWYVVWQYDETANNNLPTSITCFENEFSVNADAGTGTWEEIIVVDGNQYEQTLYFVAQTQNSIWQVSNTTIEWIDYDVVEYSWFVGGMKNSQKAIVMSRSKTLPNSTLSSVIQVVQAEGYNFNSTNTIIYPNNNCS